MTEPRCMFCGGHSGIQMVCRTCAAEYQAHHLPALERVQKLRTEYREAQRRETIAMVYALVLCIGLFALVVYRYILLPSVLH